MKLDIRHIPVYYINLDNETDKKNNIEKVLQQAGFTDVRRFSAVSDQRVAMGCAISHQSILDKIVKDGISTPFLILEDDVDISKNFDPMVEIFDDSDAIYLGTTTSARKWNYTVVDMVVNKINDDYYRIYNMLAAHAILYTNIDYAKFLSKAIKTAISVGSHQDIVRASTMKFFNVYAKNKPLFFQDDPLMRLDLQTGQSIDSMSIEYANKENLGFTCYCHKHQQTYL